MASKNKARKEDGKAEKQEVTRPKPEQIPEQGISDEIVRDFLVESNENLDLLDGELVNLEKDPTNRDTLSSIFRTFHTIKGTRLRTRPPHKSLP